MGKYSKLIVAAVGFLALLSKDYFGIEVPQETVDSLAEGIIAAVSLLAVYGVSNDAV